MILYIYNFMLIYAKILNLLDCLESLCVDT